MTVLQILKIDLLPEFLEKIPKNLRASFETLHDADLSTPDFSFYTSVSSVYSSKIEGENIELDSYVKHRRFGAQFQPDYTRKIDDLYEAYVFAKNNPLTPQNIKQAHKLLSRHIVADEWQGRYRINNMFVSTTDGKIEYVAAYPDIVEPEMMKLYADIELLLTSELSFEETFYYASLIHLVFVKIHPWSDGNGRSARLLEKWFLAQKLREKAWFVQSEKYYYENHETYYRNIRQLGIEYPLLDYSKAIDFLVMLPNSVTNE